MWATIVVVVLVAGFFVGEYSENRRFNNKKGLLGGKALKPTTPTV